jgi:hypothetical protein
MTIPPYVAELVAWLFASPSYYSLHAKSLHTRATQVVIRGRLNFERGIKRQASLERGQIRGSQLDDCSQRYCDTPPSQFSRETNVPERISFQIFENHAFDNWVSQTDA